MRLAIAVEHTCFWIRAHSRRSNFVNDFPAGQNSEWILPVDPCFCLVRASHHLDDGLEGFLHVLRLSQFVFAPLEVETKYWNPHLVNFVGVVLVISIHILI